MGQIVLQFSTTPVWQSGMIRVLSRSDFSHVDVVVPPAVKDLDAITPRPYGLLGASDPGGVMVRPPNYQKFLRRHRLTLDTPKAGEFIEKVASQIGKPFDNEALSRVFDPNWRDWRDNEKWYCAELVAWGLEQVGFWDDRKYPVQINLNHITPEDLLAYLAGEFSWQEFSKEPSDHA